MPINGYGYGYGDGNGYGSGHGYGDGDGYGSGDGNGYGPLPALSAVYDASDNMPALMAVATRMHEENTE